MQVFGGSSGLYGGVAAHGVAGEFEAMSVVNEAVEDRVSVSWVSDQIEPACYGKLAGHKR